MRRRWFRTRALAGVAGPAAFTAAWVFGTARQHGRDGYTVQVEQISGLAAPDARHPAVMTAGFLAYSAGMWLFASALDDAVGGRGRARIGPHLVRLGALGIAGAGILRRDRMLLIDLDGDEVQSGQNDLHDAASAVAFTSLFFAPLALAPDLRRHADTRMVVMSGIAATTVAAAVLVVFQSKRFRRYNGILQRVAVTLPMLPTAALALRLAARDTDPRRGSAA
ncbi:MAG: DUF998 domain-containing protein [Acidimicrobiia bacterium]|nr:DUF998 domain-containing protein [Acidimicrobiia bacterium]